MHQGVFAGRFVRWASLMAFVSMGLAACGPRDAPTEIGICFASGDETLNPMLPVELVSLEAVEPAHTIRACAAEPDFQVGGVDADGVAHWMAFTGLPSEIRLPDTTSWTTASMRMVVSVDTGKVGGHIESSNGAFLGYVDTDAGANALLRAELGELHASSVHGCGVLDEHRLVLQSDTGDSISLAPNETAELETSAGRVGVYAVYGFSAPLGSFCQGAEYPELGFLAWSQADASDP